MAETEYWLLRKNGYWYREGAHGYTSSLMEAWLCTEAEAKAHAETAAGIDMIPFSKIVGDLARQRDYLQSQIDKINSIIAAH